MLTAVESHAWIRNKRRRSEETATESVCIHAVSYNCICTSMWRMDFVVDADVSWILLCASICYLLMPWSVGLLFVSIIALNRLMTMLHFCNAQCANTTQWDIRCANTTHWHISLGDRDLQLAARVGTKVPLPIGSQWWKRQLKPKRKLGRMN